MKPNINNLAKFRELKKTFLEKDISNGTIVTIEKALKNGIVFKKPEDLALLSLPNVDAGLVADLVEFGGSVAGTPDLKRIEIIFNPVGNGKLFYGYQFILTYTNAQRFTIEESYPIEDTRRVYVDIDLNDVLENSKIAYSVKSPQGENVPITLSSQTAPNNEVLYVNKPALVNATIRVLVTATAHIPNPPVRGSYQIKGKVISSDSTSKTDGYQVVILASINNLPNGSPEYLPVAYATTETNGYFVTGFLLFSKPDDVIKVTHAKVIIAKGDIHKEIPIKLVETTDGIGRNAIKKSMIPNRLILVINEKTEGQSVEDCSCNDLNFHKKKVYEEFSYYTVVRTTEPSVIADVIEDEEEIDLEDVYGTPGRGIKVFVGVFKKFHDIKSRQVKSSTLAIAPPFGVLASARSLSAVVTNSEPPSRSVLDQPDIELLNKLTIEHKAAQVLNGKNGRVNKGRTHLDPLNQIHWDKATIYQASGIAHGHLLHFKQEWIPDGYSMGDLLYSLPLAPGQKKQIAVLDWERRESAANSQALDYEESLNSSLIRDRDISEVTSATLDENIQASSTAKTIGIAAGTGAAAMGTYKIISFGGLVGISGGASKSSTVANQTSHRDSTANSLQSIRDRTTQAANAVRSQRSTVIQTVSQGERVQATSESVANYNHCHAVTIQYFEVLRHFMIQNRFVGAQECLFIPLQIAPFDIEKSLRWRNILEQCLLRPALRPAFDSLERIQNERESPYENYYDAIGYPRKNFAEQNITLLQGELYLEFCFFNTKDTAEPAINNFILFFNAFRVSLSKDDIKDRNLTDKELSGIVGPRTVEHLLDALVIETDTGTNLNLDATLITPFRQNATLYISLRQSGLISIPREQISAIRIKFDENRVFSNEAIEIRQLADKYMKIRIRSGSLRYRTNNFSGTLFNARIDNDLFLGSDNVFIPTPLSNEELRNPKGEDVDAANNLLHHLNENLEYYHKCLWFMMPAERRYMLLDGIVAPGKAGGRSVASVVENALIGIAGNSLIMPVAPGNQLDPTIDDTFDLFAHYYKEDDEPMRVSLPTKGVYAEAVIGKCNSCEEKSESRFWRWEESPIPDSPNTQINPINTDTRRAEPGNLQPKDFPSPMVNIQNAPNLPDPSGLQNILQLLGKSDSFRDLTGLTENQRNALATFQSSLQAAQAFGTEAADLAKTAGYMNLIGEAQKKGTLANADARKLTYSLFDQKEKDKREQELKEAERKEEKVRNQDEREETKKDTDAIKEAKDAEKLDKDQETVMVEDRMRRGQKTVRPKTGTARKTRKVNVTLYVRDIEGRALLGSYLVSLGSLEHHRIDVTRMTPFISFDGVEIDTTKSTPFSIIGDPVLSSNPHDLIAIGNEFFHDASGPVHIGPSPIVEIIVQQDRETVTLEFGKEQSETQIREHVFKGEAGYESAAIPKLFAGSIKLNFGYEYHREAVTGKTNTFKHVYEIHYPKRKLKIMTVGGPSTEIDPDE